MPPPPLMPCKQCKTNIGADDTGLCASCDPTYWTNRMVASSGGGGKKINPTADPQSCGNRFKEISSHYSIEEMSHPHDLYERLGAVIMSGQMTAKQNKKGEWKKVFGFRSQWEQTEKHDYNKRVNGYAMLMGERHNMIAIDIDDPSLDCAQELMDLMTSCNLVAKTNKGFHYVWKYDPRLKQTTGTDETKIDIRSDGGCIFCEPTLAKTPEGVVVAQYEWTKMPFEDEELEEVPEEVIEYLTALDERYVGSSNTVEEEQEVEMPTGDATTTTTTDTEPKNEEDYENIAKVVQALDKKRFATYDDWVKIGMVCYNERVPMSVWETATKEKYDRYGKGSKRVCAEKWASFAKEKGRKVMGATLWKWLKTDNPTAFWSLMEFRNDFWSLIALLNHKDIAKYFYNINPDAYLWEETMGWYSLTKTNVWKHYDKSQPSGLKRHIADTMQDLAMDTKKAELATYQKKSATITDQEKQKELLKAHAQKIKQIHDAYKIFGSSDFCNGVISFLPSFFEKEDLTATMDMNRYIFAFTDGCFDLNTCSFRMISPQDYISTTTGYPYPKKTNAPIRTAVKKFLFGLFENEEDEAYLCKVLASCLYGGNRWEEFYGFTGSGGNGKGVIADLLKTAFGDYYLSVDNTLFTKPLERKDQPIPALVEARCKRIMMTTEPESDDKLQGGLIKKISGGDIIEARTLNSKHIVKYVPQFKVILQMNNIPKMSKIDGGIERRMRIINFPFKFVSAETMTDTHHRLGDPDVKEKHCKSDEWRDEFILMMSEVYKTIKDLKSLTPPRSVAEATGEYMDDNNPLKVWLNKHYDLTRLETDQIGATELKRQYMEDNHIEKMGDASFKNLLSFNNIKWKHTNVGNFYLGLKRKSVGFSEE